LEKKDPPISHVQALEGRNDITYSPTLSDDKIAKVHPTFPLYLLLPLIPRPWLLLVALLQDSTNNRIVRKKLH
jgi:hypothetical protein